MAKLKITILSTTESCITNNSGFAREGRAFRCPWLGQKNIKCIFSRKSTPPQYHVWVGNLTITMRIFPFLSLYKQAVINLLENRWEDEDQNPEVLDLSRWTNKPFEIPPPTCFRRKIIFADRGPHVKLPRRFSDSSLRFGTIFTLRAR